jgi:hypothetical protein
MESEPSVCFWTVDHGAVQALLFATTVGSSTTPPNGHHGALTPHRRTPPAAALSISSAMYPAPKQTAAQQERWTRLPPLSWVGPPRPASTVTKGGEPSQPSDPTPFVVEI